MKIMSTDDCHKVLDRIRAHQANPRVHALTCGNDSNHALQGQIMPHPNFRPGVGYVILVCPYCDYQQDYIPSGFFEKTP